MNYKPVFFIFILCNLYASIFFAAQNNTLKPACSLKLDQEPPCYGGLSAIARPVLRSPGEVGRAPEETPLIRKAEHATSRNKNRLTYTYRILDELELKTKGLNSIQSNFVQKKKLAMFTKEITIEGMIYIKKPNLFAWHVSKPVRYGLIVSDSDISQWNEDTDSVKTFSTKDNPAFNVIFNQMNKWLSGDYKPLMDDYHVSVVSDKPLLLVFVPLKSTTSYDLIESIAIKFNKDLRYLDKITIQEKNGDKTTLSFFDTKLNKQISSRAWKAKMLGPLRSDV
jgi:outer membrane lipoprotein-sorting protein